MNIIHPFYLMIGLFLIGVLVIIIASIRTHLKNRSIQTSKELDDLFNQEKNDCHERNKVLLENENNVYVDIPAALDNAFCDKIITSKEGQAFLDHIHPIYLEAKSLIKKLIFFNIPISESIETFIIGFENADKHIKEHNDKVIRLLLERYKSFFDNCLKYPLDEQQRRSIISEEDNCLVVSSAGSGKTSSIVGKVKYLTEIKGIDPKKILLISYTNKAATELTERIATDGLRGYTFHKLAIEIIGKETGVKPSICDNTDALFIETYRTLLTATSFKKSVLDCYIAIDSNQSEWEQLKDNRRESLSAQKKRLLKVFLPDMDGRTIYVRSKQEQKICYILSSLGVNFRYEEPYEHSVANEMHSQYKPDFSIYFEQNGKTKRIYLEHFGVDEHNLVPLWFAKDKNISYEEANKIYNDGITWKKVVHENFGTQLLVTSSADFENTDIKEKIKQLLIGAKVPIHEKTEDELYELVLQKDSKQEKAFIRTIASFVTLFKSSCKSIEEILNEAQKAHDDNSVHTIQRIFIPVYEKYVEMLKSRNQIDYTDLILQATEICRTKHPVEYEHIIVDEFQDISLDRYFFLKMLREGNPPAKLYCVGDDWQSIYRFSGSDMALFSQFPDFFGPTDITKIETTYRFGEPLVSLSSKFIQRNDAQIRKDIHPFNTDIKTELIFQPYFKRDYCETIKQIISTIPSDKSVFLLGRYSFDDYYLSYTYQGKKEGNKFYYIINGRKIEFLTVHKSKGLEADYVIILQCNKDVYGFPSLMADNPTFDYVLTKSDSYQFAEERRLFYVAITRAKIKTVILYDNRFPSVFVDEFLHPEKINDGQYVMHRNANKRWTPRADQFLLNLHSEGKSISYIATKMGRSQTSIVMRLNKLLQ